MEVHSTAPFSGSRLAALIAAFLIAMGGLTVAAASPADALSANCSAVKQTNHRWPQMDTHRARAYCYSIGWDTKVRATLNRSGAVDYHSSWFTSTYTYHYSGYATCYAGCSARYDVGSR